MKTKLMLASSLVAIMAVSGGSAIADVALSQHIDNTENNADITGGNFSGLATTTNGGAINNTGENVTVADSEFNGNNSGNTFGGAIYNEGASLTVTGSKFSGNYTKKAGGAIYNKSAAGLTISDSIFSDNYLTGTDLTSPGGAAVYNSGAGMNITNSQFLNNTSKTAGGAIYNTGADAIISNSKFIGNTVAATAAKTGGAIHNTGANMLITGSEFSENQTRTTGGAINNTGKELTISDTIFSDNYAGTMGGALYNSGATLTLSSVRFTGNSAGSTGGALQNTASGATILSSIFDGNVATTHGGAIYNTGSLTVGGSVFRNNISNIVVADSNTPGGGGAITNTKQLYIENTLFEGNTAKTYGGAIFSTNGGSEVEIVNSTFKNNTVDVEDGADFAAGGAYFAGSTTTTIRGSWFEGNTAKDNGAIGTSTNSGKTTILDSTFYNNSAKNTGAVGLFADSELVNVVFDSNRSTVGDAGAVFLGSESTTIMKDVTFSKNKSAKNGGAIATRTTEQNNSGATLDIDGALFSGNTAAGDGGAIWSQFYNSVNTDGAVHIANADFVDNSATNGGAIYLQGGADVKDGSAAITLSDTTFTGNRATENGGAIYNSADATVNLAGNNVFSSNTANGVANDIYNDGILNIVSGTTTLDGGIAGAGALTVSNGAVLNIGTATVVQDSIDFTDGDVHLTLNSISDYGSLKANSISVGTITIDKVTSAGKYTILDSDDINWNEDLVLGRGVGALFTRTIDGGDVEFSVKSADEIADAAGVTAQTGAAMGALASNGRFGNLNMAVQDVLENNPNAGAVLDAELSKLNPTGAPVLHAIATQMYNQVSDIAAARLSGDFATASNIWGQVLYNTAKSGDTFDSDTVGFAAGVDTHLSHDIKAGLSFTYNNSDIAVTGRDIDAESMTLALYGRYKPSAWYVNGALHYTQTEFDETASVLGFGVDSSYKTGTYGAQVAVGYDNFNRFAPEAGLRYMHITAEDYDNGVADIKLGDYDFLTAVAGIKYAMNIDLVHGWAIRPQMSLALTYDILSDDMDARVLIPGAAAYDVDLGRLARFGQEFSWGVAAQWHALELSVGYDLDVRGAYTSHTGMARFKYEF